MHHHRKTPLWVSAVAVIVAVLMAFLFGGASRAAEEASQSAAEAQSANVAESQSVSTTAQSSGAVATAATTDSNCTSRPISAEEVADQYVKTVDGTAEFTAYEAVEFGFSLALEEGHCEGDSIVFTVPNELGTDGSFMPVEMKAKDDTIVAYARYSSDHTITVTLTGAVEDASKHHFQASAWWKVHMESSLVPGETRNLEWNIGGEIRRTPISVGTCPGCSSLGEGPSKWGTVSSLKPWDLTVTVVTPTAEYDNQTFVITDRATSSGQDFACPDPTIGQAGVYSSAGPWGQPIYTRFIDATIESCSSEKVVFKIVLNKGEKARADILVNVSPEDRGPWTDEVEIVSQEKTWTVGAKVVRKESGGNAGFDPTNPPTPTPTPAPTPEPTPTPSPTPTPAPSASPSPTPSPSTTPSVTPTPSPSTSPSAPTPTPTVTQTPVPTPSVTSSPSPTPTPALTPSPSTPTSSATPAPVTTPEPARQHKLAVTGAATSATTLAIALVALGGLAIWMRRRQEARSKG